MEYLDLVDEMQWENVVDFVSLEDAGLENHADIDTVPGAQRAGYYFEEDGSAG